jgi:hypothetical protein
LKSLDSRIVAVGDLTHTSSASKHFSGVFESQYWRLFDLLVKWAVSSTPRSNLNLSGRFTTGYSASMPGIRRLVCTPGIEFKIRRFPN